MTFAPRMFVLLMAVFGAANLLASIALIRVLPRLAVRRSAQVIFLLRVLPAAFAGIVTLASSVALFFFEPRRVEPTGAIFIALAAVGAACLARMLVVGLSGQVRARSITTRWLNGASPIQLPGVTLPAFAVTSAFPIVAVVGHRHPRLIVGRSVLLACPPNELAAIVAHEMRHVVARHNLCRSILSALPDAAAWLPFGDRINDQWHVAAEREADDAAARSSATGHLDLASALIRVARLAPIGSDPMDVPMSALFRGESIDQRVERLVARRFAPVDAWPMRRALTVAAAGLCAAAFVLHPLYEILEAAVEHLP